MLKLQTINYLLWVVITGLKVRSIYTVLMLMLILKTFFFCEM